MKKLVVLVALIVGVAVSSMAQGSRPTDSYWYCTATGYRPRARLFLSNIFQAPNTIGTEYSIPFGKYLVATYSVELASNFCFEYFQLSDAQAARQQEYLQQIYRADADAYVVVLTNWQP
jgi:hypothetical protein